MLWKEKFQLYKLYACPEAKISPWVMISVVSQYVIGFTCHNESMLIGLFRQRQFADERKWLFVSADVRGAGTRDEPLRTSARDAKKYTVLRLFVGRKFLSTCIADSKYIHVQGVWKRVNDFLD